MKTNGWMSLCWGAGALLLLNPSAATADSLVRQRADSCVVMDASQAQADGNRLAWDFELKHPGTYVVQVISSVEDAERQSIRNGGRGWEAARQHLEKGVSH